jgi:hypothetical protein
MEQRNSIRMHSFAASQMYNQKLKANSVLVWQTVPFPSAHRLWSILHIILSAVQMFDICSMKWVVPVFIDWIRIARSLRDVVIENHFTSALITFYWSRIYYIQLSPIHKYCQRWLWLWLNSLSWCMTNYISLPAKWLDPLSGTQYPAMSRPNCVFHPHSYSLSLSLSLSLTLDFGTHRNESERQLCTGKG